MKKYSGDRITRSKRGAEREKMLRGFGNGNGNGIYDLLVGGGEWGEAQLALHGGFKRTSEAREQPCPTFDMCKEKRAASSETRIL